MHDITRVGAVGCGLTGASLRSKNMRPLRRVTITTALGDLVDRDLVIEAATEDPEVKAALFADIDAAVNRLATG